MFEFLDNMITYLENNFVFNAQIKLSGEVEPVNEAISIRPTSTRPGERYLQGKNEGLAFQVIVKSKSQRTAIENIENITRICDNLDRTIIPGLISCEVYVTPNFVEKTATGEYFYTSLFQVELEGY